MKKLFYIVVLALTFSILGMGCGNGSATNTLPDFQIPAFQISSDPIAPADMPPVQLPGDFGTTTQGRCPDLSGDYKIGGDQVRMRLHQEGCEGMVREMNYFDANGTWLGYQNRYILIDGQFHEDDFDANMKTKMEFDGAGNLSVVVTQARDGVIVSTNSALWSLDAQNNLHLVDTATNTVGTGVRYVVAP